MEEEESKILSLNTLVGKGGERDLFKNALWWGGEKGLRLWEKREEDFGRAQE